MNNQLSIYGNPHFSQIELSFRTGIWIVCAGCSRVRLLAKQPERHLRTVVFVSFFFVCGGVLKWFYHELVLVCVGNIAAFFPHWF